MLVQVGFDVLVLFGLASFLTLDLLNIGNTVELMVGVEVVDVLVVGVDAVVEGVVVGVDVVAQAASAASSGALALVAPVAGIQKRFDGTISIHYNMY